VLPLSAKPGTHLRVGWTLASVENGRRHPFGASGVFVRLLSASGAPASRAFASGDGTYTATVVVPDGGISDVQIGIRGWTSGPNGTRESDLLFPITNDPLPGAPRIASPGSAPVSKPTNGDRAPWILAIVAGSLVAIGLLAVGLVRRRRANRNEPRPAASGPVELGN
jgi:hypothetical protein